MSIAGLIGLVVITTGITYTFFYDELITYDEVVYAGGYYNKSSKNNYLYNNITFWVMIPTGFSSSAAYE